MCFLVPSHMTRISDCSTTTSSKLYLSELEHLLSLNHYQNLKNFRLHSNLSKKKFFTFFPAEFFLESLNETPTRDLCHLRPFAGLFHYTAYIGQVRHTWKQPFPQAWVPVPKSGCSTSDWWFRPHYRPSELLDIIITPCI